MLNRKKRNNKQIEKNCSTLENARFHSIWQIRETHRRAWLLKAEFLHVGIIYICTSKPFLSATFRWLAGLFVGWLVSWLVGLLVGWLVSWLVSWSAGQSNVWNAQNGWFWHQNFFYQNVPYFEYALEHWVEKYILAYLQSDGNYFCFCQNSSGFLPSKGEIFHIS